MDEPDLEGGLAESAAVVAFDDEPALVGPEEAIRFDPDPKNSRTPSGPRYRPPSGSSSGMYHSMSSSEDGRYVLAGECRIAGLDDFGIRWHADQIRILAGAQPLCKQCRPRRLRSASVDRTMQVRVGVEQSVADRPTRRFGPVAGPDLRVDVCGVALDGGD
jgi:hypothetical protein